MNQILTNAFVDELEKLSASRLRAAVSVVSKPLPGVPSYIDHTLMFRGKEVGHMETLRGAIVKVNIYGLPKGLGLGKKFYGEVMRRLPEQTLRSGGQVSEPAQRVWSSLAKTKGYKVKSTPGERRSFGNKHVLQIPEGTTEPLFTGRLPAAAAISVPKPRSYLPSVAEIERLLGKAGA